MPISVRISCAPTASTAIEALASICLVALCVIRLVKHHQPDTVVFLGDLAYSFPLDLILRPILSHTAVWFIHGNHDIDSCHPHGYSEIDDLAHTMGARKVVHGHHYDCLDYRSDWPRMGFKAGRVIGYGQMEKLADLEQLPAYGFLVSCFSYKIRHASAGFVRAVAIFE